MLSWLAVYKDGSVIPQRGENGKENSTARIPRQDLVAFALINRRGKPVIVQHFDPGQRFIYRRRTSINQQGAPQVCHLVGWQQTVAGQNVQHIAYVFEDGERVEMAGRWRDNHPWFDPIVVEEFDKQEISIKPDLADPKTLS